MKVKTVLRITAAAGGQRELTIELPDDEVAALRTFLRHSDDLEECRVLTEHLRASIHLNYSQETGLSFRTELPPWDDVIVLLHRLRPLILQSEHANFDKARGILGRRLDDPSLRGTLKYIGDLYSGRHMQSTMTITSNDMLMNSDRMLHLWLNAHEYHRDQEKQEFLARLHHILPLEWSQGVFMLLLLDKVEATRQLAAVATLALGERESLKIDLRSRPPD